MYSKFSDDATVSMRTANQIAKDDRKEHLDTEHLLEALLLHPTTHVLELLMAQDVDPRRMVRMLRELRAPGSSTIAGGLPQTAALKKALEQAVEESRGLHHDYVGPEHLLLGLLGAGEGNAHAVLSDLQVGLKPTRELVRTRRLGKVDLRHPTVVFQDGGSYRLLMSDIHEIPEGDRRSAQERWAYMLVDMTDGTITHEGDVIHVRPGARR